jgi:hypothetical protein
MGIAGHNGAMMAVLLLLCLASDVIAQGLPPWTI